MRLRILALIGASMMVFAGLAAQSLAAKPKKVHYSGGAGASDAYKMSFTVSAGKVINFRFVSQCAGPKNGILVPAKMKISKKNKFSFKNQQFTITGRFLAHGMARGTEVDRTGDCRSSLTWSARRS